MYKYKNKKILQLVLIAIFSFLSTSTIKTQTTAPGGVSNSIHFWLEANDLTSTHSDGQDITSWVSKGNNILTFTQYNTDPVPSVIYNGFNFNPAVNFYFNDDLSNATNRNRKLASNSTLTTSDKEAYYVFWVSDLDTENSGSTAAVISTYENDDYFGWDNAQAYANLRTGSATVPNLGQTFGLSSVMIPNDYRTSSSNTSPMQMYFNGASKTVGTARHRTRDNSSTVYIGKTGTGTGEYFFGNVYEIIIMKGSQYAYMNETDVQKVHSYFGLKYGIHLNCNYMDSKGNTIWSHILNSQYDNNVFGLINDTGGNLKINQAASSQQRYMTAFLGNLQTFNKENTSDVLQDGQYVLFGNNTPTNWLEEYRYMIGEAAFQNNLVNDEALNFLNDVRLIARTNVPGGITLNIEPEVSAKYVLVSKDPNFLPANSRAYKVVDGVANDVFLEDGDLIGFAFLGTAPGGVQNGLRMWMKADVRKNVKTTPEGKVEAWTGFSGASITYQQNDNTKRPVYDDCNTQMNYHPAIRFSASDRTFMYTSDPIMSTGAPDHYTIFTMLNNNFGTSNYSYPIGFGGTTISSATRYPAMGVIKESSETRGRGRFVDAGGVGVSTTQGAVQNGERTLFDPASTTIMYHEVKKENYIRYEFDVDGETISKDMPGKSDMKDVGKASRMNRGSTLGGASLSSRHLDGVMSEIFAYERELTQTEKDAVYSYLALKYAVTLNRNLNDPTNNFDYFLSDGTVVWPGTSSTQHQAFHNNVAGLVRDDMADFQNYQARSTANGSVLWMSLKDDITCDDEGEGLAEDRLAITWGNNGIDVDALVSFKGNDDICGKLDDRMRRVWLIDNQTGDYIDPDDHSKGRDYKPATVTIRLGGKFFPFSGGAYQLYMLVADNAEDLYPGTVPGADNTYPDATHNWKQVVPLSYVNGEYQITYTLNQKYTYITFGIKEVQGACEDCNFVGIEKNLEFTRSTWGTNGSNNVTINMNGDGHDFSANVNIAFLGGAKFYSNTYPRASSKKSLNLYRRGASNGTMVAMINLSEVAASSFKLFEVDYRSGRYDDIEVWGQCSDGNIIYPKLSYVTSEKNSSYWIDNNKLKAIRKSSSYTNKRGQVQVDFKSPVKTIFVKHTTTGRSSANAPKRIGIGPIEFSCPAPTPEPNDAGLVFIKKAPLSKLICEEIEYVYTIINTKCEEKFVNFTDQLPTGMVWVVDGLGLDNSAIVEGQTIINNYAGSGLLSVENMLIPGGAELTFRATAIFNDNITIANPEGELYGEKAHIEYKYIVDGGEKDGDLWSCDMNGGTIDDNCLTKTRVYQVDNRPKALEVLEFSTKPGKSCFEADSEIEFTIKVNNPNPTLTDVGLDMNFTEGFTLVNNKITSSNVNMGNPVDENLAEGETAFNGTISYENFSLPNGVSTFTFKIKVPDEANLPQLYDNQGNPLVDDQNNPLAAPLEVGFDFYSEASGDCLEAATANLSGTKELSLCSATTSKARKAVISNKHITAKIKK